MRTSALRTLYIVLGSVSLALGVIGAFLPVLPTTPFLLLAAYFYSKGSERLHNWLMQHPQLGPPIRDWQNHGVIRPWAKVLSLGTMSVGLLSVWTFFPEKWPYAKYALLGFMLCVSIFIATRPSAPPEDRPSDLPSPR